MFDKNLMKTIREQSERWDAPVLSVYLNVDPSQQRNLNQGYLARYKTGVRELEARLGLDEAALDLFRKVTRRVEKQLADYEPDAKALVLFRTPRGRSWRRGLHVPVREVVEWADAPALEPLAEVLDEHERYGVALVDRGRARIFAAHLGEIEEIADLATGGVSRAKTPGADHRWSEANFVRRADEHAKQHARETARALAEADRNHGFDRLLLAGLTEGREGLRAELPTPLRHKLAGSVAMSVLAAPQEVLRRVEEIHSELEREEEIELVERMMGGAASNGAAVAGLQLTVNALREGRIRELVVSGNFHPRWDELDEPAPWLHERTNETSDDLLERLVNQTAQTGGRIEVVWGAAAERLEKEAGGIGAILRY
jgi:peptide subunit release factor 1 (eRF1)